MDPILVPTINSNDTEALLVAWTKASGDCVRAGETLAVLETTKASFDLAAERDGVLETSAVAQQRVEFGAAIGWLFADAAERERFRITNPPPAPVAGGEFVLTKAAEELIARHGLTGEQLRALGRKVIKAADLAALLPSAPQTATILPDARQLTIARTVARSRATIPDSFLLKKIAVDAALDALGRFSREEKIMAALPDLLVWIAARLPGEFPFFFGALGEDLSFTPACAGNIGVTFDVGTGLFIPVVRKAATLPLQEIARQMMRFRMQAARHSFQADDLTGGDLSISINMDADIVFVQPIILPPQTCMLSLSAVMSEVALDGGGQPVARRCLHLGAAFDHRVINGFHANAFLNAIKVRLEAPDAGAWRAG